MRKILEKITLDRLIVTWLKFLFFLLLVTALYQASFPKLCFADLVLPDHIKESPDVFKFLFNLAFFSPLFALRAAVINFLINAAFFLILIRFIVKPETKTTLKPVKTCLRIFVLSYLGYYVDQLSGLFSRHLLGSYQYKEYVVMFRSEDFPVYVYSAGSIIWIYLVYFALAGFGMFALSYWLLARKYYQSTKKRVIFSLLFGLLSSPIWGMLLGINEPIL